MACSLVLSLISILHAQFIDSEGDGISDNVDRAPDFLTRATLHIPGRGDDLEVGY